METSTEVADRQFLSFQLAGEEYAVGILKVREIIEYGPVTRVPTTPAWIRGVINLRGGVVPVIDLAVRFGLPAGEVTPRTCIVIVEVELGSEKTCMGIVSDSVSQVMELRPQDIEPPPALGTRLRIEYLLGMARSERRFVLLLDIDKILSSDELSSLTECPQAEVGAAGAEPVATEAAPSRLATTA
jgi:purine-binding chemotaxis protein CheW